MKLKDQPRAVYPQLIEGTSGNSQTRPRPHAAFWRWCAAGIAMGGVFLFSAGITGASPATKNSVRGVIDGNSGAPLSPGYYHGLYLAQATAPDYGNTEKPDYSPSTNPDYGQNLNPDYGANTNPTDEQIMNPDYGENLNPDYGQNLNPKLSEGTALTGNPEEKTNPALKNPVKDPGQDPVKKAPKKVKKKKSFKLEKFKQAWKKFKKGRKK